MMTFNFQRCHSQVTPAIFAHKSSSDLGTALPCTHLMRQVGGPVQTWVRLDPGATLVCVPVSNEQSRAVGKPVGLIQLAHRTIVVVAGGCLSRCREGMARALDMERHVDSRCPLAPHR